MKQNLKYIVLIIVCFILPGHLFAEDYKYLAGRIRQEVWAWDKPEFAGYSVPEELNKESVVVLAHHEQIEALVKSALWSRSLSPVLHYTHIDRVMVKINDQAALDEYSTLFYEEEVDVMLYNVVQTIIGARVIKPDGTIKEIDIDGNAVDMTEGKNDKKKSKRLAIPDLQTGDILDYFYCKKMELETIRVPPLLFSFYSKYPVLSYSVHGEFEDKLTVEYKSVNGAPDLKVSKDTSNRMIVDVQQKNLQQVGDLRKIRWLSAYRDFPMIRLSVSNNSSKQLQTANARKNGVFKDVPYEDILKDAKGLLAKQDMLWMKDIDKKVNAALTNYKQKNPDLSKEDLASCIYDALCFYWPNNINGYPPAKFFLRLQQLLSENDIESKFIFTTNRYGAGRNGVVSSDDLSFALTANHNKQFFPFVNENILAGEIPGKYQGELASALVIDKNGKKFKQQIEKGSIEDIRIPETTYHENRNRSKMKVEFSDNDPLLLNIDRNTIYTGNLKEDLFPLLVLYEDRDKAMRKRLLIDKTLMEELQEDKREQKHVEAYTSLFDAKRKGQKDAIKLEIEAYHNIEPKEVFDYSVNSLGIVASDPNLNYEIKYQIDGFVTKAGENLILDAGKLIGIQWVPTPRERERTADAYLPTARLFENEIEVLIPSIYNLQGFEALNCGMENEYGAFEAEVSYADQVLKVKTRKIYKRAFVPEEGWPMLLEMIDKANDFYIRSVVLKKKV
ncbi:MAG: DUF3857 domain-containing protein [Mangrovibacterium sp.]